MVFVFHGSEVSNYSISDLQSMTSTELMIAATKTDCFDNTALAKNGVFIPNDQPLSEIPISNHDTFRIVTKDENPLAKQKSFADLQREMKGLVKAVKRSPQYFESTVHKILTDKDFALSMIKHDPNLASDLQSFDIFSDPMLSAFNILNKPERYCRDGPAFYEILVNVIKLALITKNAPVLYDFGDEEPMDQGQAQGQGIAATGRGQITREMLNQAIQFALNGSGPPPLPVPAPEVDRVVGPADPMSILRSEYTVQLAQLVEFGFSDEAQNLLVLQSTDGDVDMSLDILIAMREQD